MCVCVRVRVRVHAYVTIESSWSVKQKYTRPSRRVYNFLYYHTNVSNDNL